MASADGDKFCCPRCSGRLRAKTSAVADAANSDQCEPAAGSPPPHYDSWELDQQLRDIQRMLDTGKIGSDRPRADDRRQVARLDPPHGDLSAWHQPAAGRAPRRPGSNRASHFVLAALTWTALSLGTMAFVCGGILLGWSVLSGRTELWNVGMPIALCGQIALLVGLILQLDRLWHDSRRAAAKLDDVDQQLHELKTTTTMLSTGQGSPGSAFYSHLAGGAGPQILLSDLKSQLDLLAVKIMQQDG